MMKGVIQQEDITLLIIYAPNIGAPKQIKWISMDIKGETDSNTVIVWGFNTPLTSMNIPTQENCNFKWHTRSEGLNSFIQSILFKAAEYIFYSYAHETFLTIDNMLGHKSLNKLKKIELISNILHMFMWYTYHSGRKIDV